MEIKMLLTAKWNEEQSHQEMLHTQVVPFFSMNSWSERHDAFSEFAMSLNDKSLGHADWGKFDIYESFKEGDYIVDGFKKSIRMTAIPVLEFRQKYFQLTEISI